MTKIEEAQQISLEISDLLAKKELSADCVLGGICLTFETALIALKEILPSDDRFNQMFENVLLNVTSFTQGLLQTMKDVDKSTSDLKIKKEKGVAKLS